MIHYLLCCFVYLLSDCAQHMDPRNLSGSARERWIFLKGGRECSPSCEMSMKPIYKNLMHWLLITSFDLRLSASTYPWGLGTIHYCRYKCQCQCQCQCQYEWYISLRRTCSVSFAPTRHDMTRHDTASHDTTSHVMILHGMTRHDMTQYIIS